MPPTDYGRRVLHIVALILTTLGGSSVVADTSNPVLSGFGTAIVDGVFTPDEWSSAASIQFDANVPEGGTTPATLYVMNDDTNLYLAISIVRPSFGGATNPVFEFDNDNDGVLFEDGDDGIGMDVGIFSEARFGDTVRTTEPPCPSGAVCGFADISVGGTTDGATAATNDGQITIIELMHPLNSSDDQNDFNLSRGMTVGFTLGLRLFNLNPVLNESFADTAFPAFGSGKIPIQPQDNGPAVTTVDIDIKPGSFPNSINPDSGGVVPVAILSSATFDATQIDPATVTLAGAALRLTGSGTFSCSSQDANGDGQLDLLCQVETAQLIIEPGDSVAVLEAKTFAGQSIRGEDSIRIVGVPSANPPAAGRGLLTLSVSVTESIDFTSTYTVMNSYNSRGNLLVIVRVWDNDSNGTAETRQTVTSRYDPRGNVLVSVTGNDFNGDGTADSQEIVTNTYDRVGHLLSSVTEADYDGDGVVTFFQRVTKTYDVAGNLLTEVYVADYNGDGAVDTQSAATHTYGVDGTRFSIYEADYDGDGTLNGRTTETTTYDKHGRVLMIESTDDFDGDGTLEQLTTWTKTYDRHGNLLSQVLVQDYGVDGTLDYKEPLTNTYDARGRLLSTLIEYDYGADGFVDYLRSEIYTHDTRGNILTITVDDGVGTVDQRWTRSYDAKGHLIGEVSEFDFDNDGVFESHTVTTNTY